MVSQNISEDFNINGLIVCMTLACVLFVSRQVARFYKTQSFVPEIEDIFMFLALVFYLTMDGLYISALPVIYRLFSYAEGLEPAWPTLYDDDVYMVKEFFAIDMLFWATLWSVKFSLLFMFRRLTSGLPKYQNYWYFVTGFTFVVLVGALISNVTACSSMTAWFTPGGCETDRDTVGKAASLYYSLAVDLVTDLLVMSIPIRLLWNLQINTAEKIGVGGAFSVGIITMIFAIVRVVSLDSSVKSGEVNPTWLALWGNVEGLVSILVGCLPPFAIFLRSRVMATRATYDYNVSETKASAPQSRVKSRIRAESILLDDVQPTGLATKDGSSMKSEHTQPWAPTWQQSHVEASSDNEEVKEGRGIQITHSVLQTSKTR